MNKITQTCVLSDKYRRTAIKPCADCLRILLLTGFFFSPALHADHKTVSNLFLGDEGVSENGSISDGHELDVVGELRIGMPAASSYTQSGGKLTATRLVAGDTGIGNYYMSGGQVFTRTSIVGWKAGSLGLFSQSSGVHEVRKVFSSSDGVLFIAPFDDSFGEYWLSGDGVLKVAENIEVANGGRGKFTQSGGSITTGTNGAGDVILGVSYFGEGSYNMTGGSLTVGRDLLVGDDGVGDFTQNSFTSAVHIADDLRIAGKRTDLESIYTLTNGSISIADELSVGYIGKGAFVQNGGTVTVGFDLDIADDGHSSEGRYELKGGVLIVGRDSSIGDEGTATFTQTGGTHRVNDDLFIASQHDSSGTYNLNGSKGTTFLDVVDNVYVGDEGFGVFNHESGTFTVGDEVYLGDFAGGEGIYNMTGKDAVLTIVEQLNVGSRGKGTFNQSKGSVSIGQYLDLGDNVIAADGTYNLSGGKLTVGIDTTVADEGQGRFIQTGGEHIIGDDLYIGYEVGANGVYELDQQDGFLGFGVQVNDALVVAEEGNGIFRLKNGIVNVDGVTTIGAVASADGRFEQSGGKLISNALVIGRDRKSGNIFSRGVYQLSSGTAQFNDITVGVDGDASFNMTGGKLEVSNTVSIGTGLFQTAEGDVPAIAELAVLGGEFTTRKVSVGVNKSGELRIKNAAKATLTDLVAGVNEKSNGVVIIADDNTALTADTIIIGKKGTARLSHSDTLDTRATRIILGDEKDSDGTWNHLSGVLTTQFFNVGVEGKGTFIMEEGEIKVTDTLSIGSGLDGTGEFLAGGTVTRPSTLVTEDVNIGQESVPGVEIERLGTGKMVISGEVEHVVSGEITTYGIKTAEGLVSQGTYEFDGKKLTTNGIDNAGTFIYKGGEIEVADSGGVANPAFLNTGKVVLETSLADIGTAMVTKSGEVVVVGGDLDAPTKVATFQDLLRATVSIRKKTVVDKWSEIEFSAGTKFTSYNKVRMIDADGNEIKGDVDALLILSGNPGSPVHKLEKDATLDFSNGGLSIINAELHLGDNSIIDMLYGTVSGSTVLGTGTINAFSLEEDSLLISNSQIGDNNKEKQQPVINSDGIIMKGTKLFGTINTEYLTLSTGNILDEGIINVLDLDIESGVSGTGEIKAKNVILKSAVEDSEEQVIAPRFSAEELRLERGFWTLDDVVQIENGVLDNANWIILEGRLTTRQEVHTLGQSAKVSIYKNNGAEWVNYNLKKNLGTLSASGTLAAPLLENNGTLIIKDKLQIDINEGPVLEERPEASGELFFSSSETVTPLDPAISAAIGSLTIDGDLVLLSESIVELEIAGLLQGEAYDLLSVTGNMTLGGLLSIQFIGDFLPEIDDTFSLIEVDGDIFSAFSRIEILGIDGLLGYDLDFIAGKLVLSNIEVSAVPLPASALLLLTGLGMLAGASRYRAKQLAA